MLQLIWNIIFLVLAVLAVCWALYERDAHKKSDLEWDRGMDEMSSDYEQMLISAYEQHQLLDATAEGYYEEVQDVERDRLAYREVAIEKEQRAMQLTQALDASRAAHGATTDELYSMQTLFTQLNQDHDEIEELYAEAATELLETNDEIERVAREVHDWTVRGGPFDA